MNDWQRLDPKIMVIGPISAFRQFLFPSLVALIGVGTQQPRWLLYAAPVIILGSIGVGLVPWFSTRFRVADGQLVVTTGLVSRTRLTAPLDRIRTVDLEASLLHRVLGLEKVEVGTGVDDTMIELNALSRSQAAELRGVLLSRRTPSASSSTAITPPRADEPPADVAAPPHTEEVLATFSPGWARFAPLSLGRLAIALGALGALWQFIGDVRIDLSRGHEIWELVAGASVVLVILVLVLGALVAWTALSMVAFLVQWWDLRLVRDRDNLHLTRGLLTTTSTTVEVRRIRGVQVRETALVRAAAGGELHALVTGLEESVHAVLPLTPIKLTTDVAGTVLGSREPLTAGLLQHGPAALARCRTRNLFSLLPVPVATLALVLLLDGSWWLPVVVAIALVPVALLLARSEFAHLGHALTTEHLVAGSGTTARVRTVLQRDGVIGWVVSQTWFQRRRGLATLIATTAAGAEKVTIRDIPLTDAVAFARAATPGMLDPFLADA
ncbi:PH domain-containing protein [Nocardioides sp. JQ2195]|uniref:PH domain-containing protein n=1 Tax=Nocardioides sp. JQ2195 TaxID=2592334 RepID=UPI00143E3B90|nr:PH domain-containing protein [Nocardioides sp. JQ2195]QIX27716.1 PH domain-containing protein [Nocardioides sp. JQ2195]